MENKADKCETQIHWNFCLADAMAVKAGDKIKCIRSGYKPREGEVFIVGHTVQKEVLVIWDSFGDVFEKVN